MDSNASKQTPAKLCCWEDCDFLVSWLVPAELLRTTPKNSLEILQPNEAPPTRTPVSGAAVQTSKNEEEYQYVNISHHQYVHVMHSNAPVLTLKDSNGNLIDEAFGMYMRTRMCVVSMHTFYDNHS